MPNIKVLENKAVNPAKSIPSSILEKQRLSNYFLNSSVIAQIRSVIQTAGETVSSTDVDATSVDPLLLAKAISAYVHAGNFYQDIGTADEYILTPTKEFDLLDQNEKTHTGASKIHTQTPASLLDGMLIRFRPANNNTAASTVEIKCNIITFNGTSGELEKTEVSLGVKDIKKLDGITALSAGYLQTNTDIELRYSASLDCFILTQNSLASQPISILKPVATSGSYNDLLNKPTIPAAQINSDWNSSLGVSQILNKPTLGTAASQNVVNGLFYIGDLKTSAQIANHGKWLICQGAAISRTTYSALFALIGTSFGTGDGSTTFNLPDARSSVLGSIGQGAGLTNRTLGQVIGEETHTLNVNEMPTHNHVSPDGSNFLTDLNSSGTAAGGSGFRRGGNTTQSTGGNLSHNNMQPTLFAGNTFIYAGV